MTYKQILHKIDEVQISNFVSIDDFRNIDLDNTLHTEQQGLYWFWTNLTNEQLKQIDTRENSKEVPISYLTYKRESLSHSCNYFHGGFRIVYNGIGSGLRERILQELKCSSKNTGTLNLQRRTNLNNWRVSYFNFSNPKNQDIIKELSDESFPYYSYAEELERDWRIEFGQPILNRI